MQFGHKDVTSVLRDKHITSLPPLVTPRPTGKSPKAKVIMDSARLLVIILNYFDKNN